MIWSRSLRGESEHGAPDTECVARMCAPSAHNQLNAYFRGLSSRRDSFIRAPRSALSRCTPEHRRQRAENQTLRPHRSHPRLRLERVGASPGLAKVSAALSTPGSGGPLKRMSWALLVLLSLATTVSAQSCTPNPHLQHRTPCWHTHSTSTTILVTHCAATYGPRLPQIVLMLPPCAWGG